MTRCNYCVLQDFKKLAVAHRGTVETQPAAHDFAPDGVDVFIHYPTESEPVWTAWLMKLPERCAC